MHFTIVGSKQSPNTLDLIEEITRSGHTVSCVFLSSIGLFFQQPSSEVMSATESHLDTTDIFLFRGFEKNYRVARTLARMALSKNKVVIDEVIAHRDIANKLSQAQIFQVKNIPHPKTFYTLSREVFDTTIEKIGFPLIAKPVGGARGEDIHLIETKQAALEFFLAHPKTHLYQEYFPILSDIRVFVIGGIVLGAIRRHVLAGDVRSNASLGAKTEAIQLSAELTALAIRAASIFDYEIAGVDIMETSAGDMVIEVNHTPQWQGFKAATNINPAKEIIRYAIEKHSLSHPIAS